MKNILIIIVSVSLLLSFYKWTIYTYNAKESYGNIQGLKDLYSKDGDISKDENNKLIQAKTSQIDWEVSRKEWRQKLCLDLVVFVYALIYLFGNRLKKNCC